jgi:hypothetical protein
MPVFPAFTHKHGLGLQYAPAHQKLIEGYRDQLPAVLLEEWQAVGFCSYGKGLMWLVDPLEYRDLLGLWLDPSEGALVFGRTAFGDLLLWWKGEIHLLYVDYARTHRMFDDLEFFFEHSLCEPSFIRSFLESPMFKKALKKCGPLEADECYGFVPLPKSGDVGKIDDLQKVNLSKYLKLLLKAKGPLTIVG